MAYDSEFCQLKIGKNMWIQHYSTESGKKPTDMGTTEATKVGTSPADDCPKKNHHISAYFSLVNWYISARWMRSKIIKDRNFTRKIMWDLWIFRSIFMAISMGNTLINHEILKAPFPNQNRRWCNQQAKIKRSLARFRHCHGLPNSL